MKRPETPIKVLREEVISEGSEPRALLRYRNTAKPATVLRQRAVATITDTVDGKRQPSIALPAVTTGFEVAWKQGDTLGLTIRGAAPEVIVGGEPAAAELAELNLARFRKLLAGKRAEIRFDPRGQLGAAVVVGTADKETGREFLAALVDLVVPLPEVPVGVGAEWMFTRAVPRGRHVVKQLGRYKLVAKNGDTLTIDVALDTIGERQPIDVEADLPIGAKAELLALRGRRTGTVTVVLTQAVPIKANYSRGDSIHTRVSQGDQILADLFSEGTTTIELTSKR